MKITKLLLAFLFVSFATGACSKVGSLISNTGEFVSKTGAIIAGNNKNNSVSSRKQIDHKFIQKKTLKEAKKVAKVRLVRPSVISVEVLTTRTVNPNKSGKPTRIKITVLQLKSVGKFSSSRLSSLQSELEASLGADFISEESFSQLPNKRKVITIPLDSSTKYLGVFASFKQLNNTIWKTKLSLPNINRSYSVKVVVDKKSITSKKK